MHSNSIEKNERLRNVINLTDKFLSTDITDSALDNGNMNSEQKEIHAELIQDVEDCLWFDNDVEEPCYTFNQNKN